MTVSYTKLNRYLSNPARAYANYVKHDGTAYPIDNQEALVYGRILHDKMAGIEVSLSEDEKKIAYKYGKEERGLKSSFESIVDVHASMLDSLHELYKHFELDYISINYNSEVEFENDLFNGRYDYVDYDNKIIIDWKTVSPRVDFDKAWSDRDGTYTSWIHSTTYDLQAFIYLYSIQQELSQSGWRYFVIAASKSDTPRTRVIEMNNVLQNFELQDLVDNTLSDIKQYESGKKVPEMINDKSDWYEENKPFKIEEY